MKRTEEEKRRIGEVMRRWYAEHPEQRRALGEQKKREALERLASNGHDHITQKRCTTCKELKPIEEFSIRRDKLKSGVVHIRPESSCRACCAARAKRNKEEREARGVDEKARALETHRKWREKMSAARRKEYRRKERERQAAKRREKGIPPRNLRKRRHSYRLPVAPIKEFVESRPETLPEMEKITGLPERRLRDIEEGKYATVTLETVDRILLGFGCQHRLDELYPVEEKQRHRSGYGVEDPQGILEKYRNGA